MKKIKYIFCFIFLIEISSCSKIDDFLNSFFNPNVQGEEKSTKSFYYQEDFVDSLNVIVTEDGYACLFGVEERDDTPNRYNRVFYISKVDLTTGDVVLSNDNICVVVDSLGIPNSITMNNYSILVTNITGDYFDCIIYEDGCEDVILTNLSLSTILSLSKTTSPQTKAIATSDAIPLFGLDDLIDGIGRTQTLQALIAAATNREKISAGLGAIGSIIGGEVGLSLGGIADYLAGSLRNSYLALAGYMWSANQKFILNHIGPWRVSIESVEQISRNSCLVRYSVEGIWPNCEGTPRIYLNCQKSDKNKHTGKVIQGKELGPATNGYHEARIDNLSAGFYLFEIRMYDACHQVTNISVRTYPPILLEMFDIALNRYEIDKDPKYEHGTVNFNIDVYIDGDEEVLKDCSECGYYISYANKIDYYPIKNFSSVFSSTPAHCELNIEREGFDNVDLSSFTAKATGYKIGVYVAMDKNNVVQHFDERELDGLIYHQRPQITFLSAEIYGTDIENDDEGNPYYCSTSFGATYNAQGTFWAKTVDLVVTQGEASDNVGYWEILEDGNQSFSAYYQYPYGGGNSAFKFDMIMDDGQRISSSNSVLLSGSPIISNASVIGATKSVMNTESYIGLKDRGCYISIYHK